MPRNTRGNSCFNDDCIGVFWQIKKQADTLKEVLPRGAAVDRFKRCGGGGETADICCSNAALVAETTAGLQINDFDSLVIC